MCSFSPGGSSGTRYFQAGTNATVYVVVYDSDPNLLGQFVIYNSRTNQEYSIGARPYKSKPVYEETYMLYLRVTIPVTGDMFVDFPW